MKKSIKKFEGKEVKNVKAVKGGNNINNDFLDLALSVDSCFQISR
jgi:hypothetical protein